MDQDKIEHKSKQRKVIKKEVSVDLKNAEEKIPKPRTSSRNSRIPISTLRSQFLNTVQEKGLNKHQKCVVPKPATQAINPSSVVEDSKVQDNLKIPANFNKDNLGLKAKSDISVVTTVSVRNEDVVVHLPTTSTGRSNVGTSCITQEQIEALNKKGTVTDCVDLKFARELRSIIESRKNELIDKNFKECLIDKLYEQAVVKNNLNVAVEPPLEPKYSVIKVPTWKRSWTFPVITRNVGIQSCSCAENDNRTYVYDDGSQIDSVFLRRNELKHKLSECFQRNQLMHRFSAFLQRSALMHRLSVFSRGNELMHRFSAFLRRNELMHRLSVFLRRNKLKHILSSIDHTRFLTLLGVMCAFLLVAIIIYVVFGDQIVQYFLPQEEPEWFINRYIKYLEGGFTHFFTGFFHALAELMDFSEEERPRNPFRW